MPKFSNAEKAQEMKRELGMRRHVYPKKVADGKMQQAAADRLIALAEDMLADYERLAAADAPDLFAESMQQTDAPNDGIYRGTSPRGGRYEPRKELQSRHASPDPTFGKTPGRTIETGAKFEECRCGSRVLRGLVRDAMSGTLNTRIFEAVPLTHNGQNYYTRHNCDARRRGPKQ